MYRLTAPNLFIFIPFVVVGILLATVTPNYIDASRVLSIVSLTIGQIGMSFIPVIALFPKANPTQGIILAITYFITTFIICVAAWALYTVGLTAEYAFQWKDEQFHVNIGALFVANAFAFACIVLCFKLIYDEELTKNLKTRAKKFRGASRFKFGGIQSHLLKRPQMGGDNFPKSAPSPARERSSSPKQSSEDLYLEEDFGKPFEFEPQDNVTADTLPEESKGNLYSPEVEEKSEVSEFFAETDHEINTSSKVVSPPPQSIKEDLKNDDLFSGLETPQNTTSQSAVIEESPITPPKDIKDDLGDIFEQYSSLDAIKKITDEKNEEISQKRKEAVEKVKKESEKATVKIEEDEEIEEATFRQLPEVEKTIIPETPPETKKEEPTTPVEESPVKEENITDERLAEPTSAPESIKEQSPPPLTVEEKDKLHNALLALKSEKSIKGAVFLTPSGEVITEDLENIEFTDNQKSSLTKMFIEYCNETKVTEQGELAHLLLESDNGTLVLANLGDKFLTVITDGKEEIQMAHILRAITRVEEGL